MTDLFMHPRPDLENEKNLEKLTPRERSDMAAYSLGGVAIVAGLGTLLAMGAIIDARKSEEVVHAYTARADMQNALLALTGNELVDNSSQDGSLLFNLYDTDTFAIPTGEPDPIAGRKYIELAYSELEGTYKNQTVADELLALSNNPILDVKEVYDIATSIRTEVHNGQMISGEDLAVGGVALGGIAIGGLLLFAPRRAEKKE